ncbi:hypothetical protein HQN86_25155 [Pedobacter panaciterrae]|uniref:hypothetical protein n=1 Tax=Pedobacter panaciterrae TaxID=363849 RepID=UPI00155D8D69|nr:hypothetical protein [Pedobacter panaciterrae]NQX56931.1 hypothetical protein [Pedobacter panaciterrae]
MGIGFNLLIILILLPLTIILLTGWLITRKVIYGKTLGLIWLAIFGLYILTLVMHTLTKKKLLKKDDFYGHYIINKSFFPGKDADWQYDSFQFEIKENDSLYFYIMDAGKIVNTISGTIKTVKPYQSQRLILNVRQPRSHLIDSIPTIYRDSWNFYLVFHSPKFGNMYYKKGKWKPR